MTTSAGDAGLVVVATGSYLDEHVTVLARMHTKRLPAYRSLGFDAPTRTTAPLADHDDAF